MPAEFHFLRPEWLFALPVVLGLAIVFAWRRFGRGRWEAVVDEALAPYVLSVTQSKRRDGRWLVFALTGVLGVLALAGPAWERIEQPVFRSDQSLVVALDLSRSMDAQDVSPSRLSRARLKILDLLERRDGGQTALVVYSANAFTVTPLTTDSDTVAALVNSLSTDIMPSRGSYPVAAINKSRQLLEQASVTVGEILLITDGGSSPAAERVARELRGTGFTLSILGVGTEEGAPIPRSTGGFVTAQSGRIAVPRLEERSLRSLASAGGGRYTVLTADSTDLDFLLSGEVTAARESDDSQATDQWREEGPWIVLLMLPFAALAFRRGWALVLLVAFVPVANQAHASVWDDIWSNRDQQAEQLLEEGDPAAAADLFEDEEWGAVSRYRAGDYVRSAEEFALGDDARSYYNLGNALAMQGDLEGAIDAYDRSLELEPDNDDARYNQQLVTRIKEQRELQQQQEGEQQENAESSGDSQNSDSEGEQQPSDGAEGESQGNSEESESSDRQEDEDADEALEALQQELQRAAEQAEQMSPEELAELRYQQAEEQAMEQWLRRIQNDPGGLLRRKFRYQYQRLGRDQDGNSLWPDNEAQPW